MKTLKKILLRFFVIARNEISILIQLLLWSLSAHGQDTTAIISRYTLEEAFELAIKNSEQIKIVTTSEELMHQRVEVVKLAHLPNLSTGFNYGYLSNSQIWDPTFSEHRTSPVPHHLTQLSLQASQVLYRGGEVKNSILKANQERQVAELIIGRSAAEIKLLVASRYFDIYRLMNQKKVYRNNIELSAKRLQNIRDLKKQGVVTDNDVLRTELIISNLERVLRRTENSIVILNEQINMLLGQHESIRLSPDISLLKSLDTIQGVDNLLRSAYRDNHEMQISNAELSVANTQLALLGSDRKPEVSLFAASNFQRPFVNTFPAVDIYYNVYQVGVSLRYNIASLYQSERKIKTGRIQVKQALQKTELQKQNTELAVRAAYIRLTEARKDLISTKEDLKSAEENFRIVERKYFNQLSLLTDLIDATNTKIESEINVTNAEIDIAFNYFKLLYSTGAL